MTEKRVREMAVLLALKMEERAASQGMQATLGKGGKWMVHWHLQKGTWPC